MSIQAVAWVLAQPAEDLPGTARLVLISLANHADHTSGHCWPSVETIGKEAGYGERTVQRYLAALARNGFIEKRQGRKGDQFRSNDYWILFDRKPGPWEFFEPKEDPPRDPPSANMADGSPVVAETRPPDVADGRPPSGGGRIEAEPSESEPSESEILEGRAQPAESPPAPPAPQGFASDKRQREMARQKAAEEARKPKSHPVIRGSAPWEAWVKAGHRETLCVPIVMPDGRKDWGWYFKTLWPKHEATGPPPDTKKAG